MAKKKVVKKKATKKEVAENAREKKIQKEIEDFNVAFKKIEKDIKKLGDKHGVCLLIQGYHRQSNTPFTVAEVESSFELDALTNLIRKAALR